MNATKSPGYTINLFLYTPMLHAYTVKSFVHNAKSHVDDIHIYSVKPPLYTAIWESKWQVCMKEQKYAIFGPSSDALESDKVSALLGFLLNIVRKCIDITIYIWMETPHLTWEAEEYVESFVLIVCPILKKILGWAANFIFLAGVFVLDAKLCGLNSLDRNGSNAKFSVPKWSIHTLLLTGGTLLFKIIVVLSGSIILIQTFFLSVVNVGVCSHTELWLTGTFLVTGLVVFAGGVSFALKHERLSVFLATIYAMYCAKCYVGWLGLFLGLNLSFISSDILIHFLKSNMNENGFDGHPRYEQPQASSSDFFAEPMQNSPTDDAFQSAYRRPADQSAGIPSTSGADAELSSEDEVVRLLNCNDHYSALGFSRYDNIDVSILKREYRKKAMLVHPDKNMGNEKAAEAFKKLQNGYEILLDSLKRKIYDDELRREDLLNYLRRFQTVSRKWEAGCFGSVFSHSEVEDEEPHGDSRRIACKKCNDIHIWACTDRSKSRARWCQDCNDFHQAKDGDGWVEQSSQPFMFGFLQRVDPPCAFVCAESKIYKVTEWFICQGMRCPANTHKPSFHVNTSITSSKHSGSKGATGSGHKAPTTNLEESMTEEEFLEWLQNAVQSGMFEVNGMSGMSGESPLAKAGSSSKSGGKKKKKGKKQW
ncbi:hypothetical protein QJS10_CPB04g01033 [Acorus calamus]|uniref:J domain-containing protein n=1 Tax=Acorus calamus TaxID=4465 RepID=A0AAV9F1Q6_ACOCL|nr:hypothetical protein QJS10_CPB04g01033 [Acorus calamus]